MSGRFGICSKQLWCLMKHFRNVSPCILLTVFKPTMAVIDHNSYSLQLRSIKTLSLMLISFWYWMDSLIHCCWWLVSLTVTWVTPVLTRPSLTVVCAHKQPVNWPVLLKTHWAEMPSDSSPASLLMTMKASAQMTHHVFLSLLSSPSHMATR